jgi:hypothetical protein
LGYSPPRLQEAEDTVMRRRCAVPCHTNSKNNTDQRRKEERQRRREIVVRLLDEIIAIDESNPVMIRSDEPRRSSNGASHH